MVSVDGLQLPCSAVTGPSIAGVNYVLDSFAQSLSPLCAVRDSESSSIDGAAVLNAGQVGSTSPYCDYEIAFAPKRAPQAPSLFLRCHANPGCDDEATTEAASESLPGDPSSTASTEGDDDWWRGATSGIGASSPSVGVAAGASMTAQRFVGPPGLPHRPSRVIPPRSSVSVAGAPLRARPPPPTIKPSQAEIPLWDAADPMALVDIAPVEGRRQGAELMAMLGVAQAFPPRPLCRSEGAPGRLVNGDYEGRGLRVSGSAPGLQPRWQYPGNTGTAGATAVPGRALKSPPRFANPGFPAAGCSGLAVSASGPVPSLRADHLVGLGCGLCTHASQAAAVNKAARQAFGQELVDVRDGPLGGFIVWLRCPMGKEMLADQSVLDLLERQLWCSLGDEIMNIDRHNAVLDATGSTSTSLTMWFLQDGSEARGRNFCWDFARRGVCPRGSHCRWLHSSLRTRPVDIELTTV